MRKSTQFWESFIFSGFWWNKLYWRSQSWLLEVHQNTLAANFEEKVIDETSCIISHEKFLLEFPKPVCTYKIDVFRGIFFVEKIQFFFTLFAFLSQKSCGSFPISVFNVTKRCFWQPCKPKHWINEISRLVFSRVFFTTWGVLWTVYSWKTHEHLFLSNFGWKKVGSDPKFDNVYAEVLWRLFSISLIFKSFFGRWVKKYFSWSFQDWLIAYLFKKLYIFSTLTDNIQVLFPKLFSTFPVGFLDGSNVLEVHVNL